MNPKKHLTMQSSCTFGTHFKLIPEIISIDNFKTLFKH